METISSAETPLTNYQPAPRNIPERRRPQDGVRQE